MISEDLELLLEGKQTSRYSVEVNYRSSKLEVFDQFAKIVLGYISAGMKNCGYHCKTVFTDKPFRVLISTRNWDDGEWVGVVCWNHKTHAFMMGKGYFNKDRKSVSIEEVKEIDESAANEIVRVLRNKMESLKKETPRGSNSLNPAQMKRGPKPKKIKMTWRPKKK